MNAIRLITESIDKKMKSECKNNKRMVVENDNSDEEVGFKKFIKLNFNKYANKFVVQLCDDFIEQSNGASISRIKKLAQYHIMDMGEEYVNDIVEEMFNDYGGFSPKYRKEENEKAKKEDTYFYFSTKFLNKDELLKCIDTLADMTENRLSNINKR